MTEHKVAVCYRFNLWQTAAFPYFTEPLPAGILKRTIIPEEDTLWTIQLLDFRVSGSTEN